MLALRFFLLAAAVLGCTTSAAAEGDKTVSLDYMAGVGCPSKSGFIAQVSARTALVKIVARQADVPRVTVWLREAAEGVVGTVQVGSDAPRTVSDSSCVDVAAALALISALSLDPTASTAALPKSLTEPSETEETLVSAAATPEANEKTPGTEPRQSLPSEAPRPPATSAPDQPTRRLQVAGWQPHVAFAVSRGFSEGALLWLGGRAGAIANVRFGQSPLGKVGVQAVFSRSPQVTPALGSATFQLLAGRLNVCPPALARGRIAVAPCLSAELGSLSAYGESGRGVVSSRDIRRTWLAAAQTLSVELTLKEPYYLSFEAELREPLRKYEFIFESPATQIATVPALELGGVLGAGVRL